MKKKIYRKTERKIERGSDFEPFQASWKVLLNNIALERFLVYKNIVSNRVLDKIIRFTTSFIFS